MVDVYGAKAESLGVVIYTPCNFYLPAEPGVFWGEMSELVFPKPSSSMQWPKEQILKVKFPFFK